MKAFFRFYQELNDFLPPGKRNSLAQLTFHQKTTVKDAVESLGIPHTEVDLILVNKESVPFSYLLQDQDYVSVFPMFRSFVIDSLNRLRALPLQKTSSDKFLVDVNLGKLAHLLRMLGFDVAFDLERHSDVELAQTAAQEDRVLLTRDRDLLKRKIIEKGYYVRDSKPIDQVLDVLRRYSLQKKIALCSRCIDCNVPVVEIAKETVIPLAPPRVAETYSQFYQCPQCRKIYWKGSHFTSMAKFRQELQNLYMQQTQT